MTENAVDMLPLLKVGVLDFPEHKQFSPVSPRGNRHIHIIYLNHGCVSQ